MGHGHTVESCNEKCYESDWCTHIIIDPKENHLCYMISGCKGELYPNNGDVYYQSNKDLDVTN